MIVVCPRCTRKYDPGVNMTYALEHAAKSGMAGTDVSIKVCCPVCEQWLRLPENQAIPAPDLPPHVMQTVKSQAQVIDEGPSQRPTTKSKTAAPAQTHIFAECPKCKTSLRAPIKFAGQTVKCPRCQSQIPIASSTADGNGAAEDPDDWGDSLDLPDQPVLRRGPPKKNLIQKFESFAGSSVWGTMAKYWMLIYGVVVIPITWLWPYFPMNFIAWSGIAIFGFVAFATVLGLWIKSFDKDLSTEVFFIPWLIPVIHLGFALAMYGDIPPWKPFVAMCMGAFFTMVIFAPICGIWIPQKKRKLLSPYLELSWHSRIGFLGSLVAMAIVENAAHTTILQHYTGWLFGRQPAFAAQGFDQPDWNAPADVPEIPDAVADRPQQQPAPRIAVRPAPANVNVEVKYKPGDRVRAKFLDRTFTAVVIEQFNDKHVIVKSEGVQKGDPKPALEKDRNVVVPIEAIAERL